MNPKQMILLGVGVVGLCAAIGIAVTSFGTRSTDTTPEPTSQPDAPIDFPDVQKPKTQESYTAGHHVFRFKSKVDKATMVGINRKNCKCASVEICLAPDDWKGLSAEELNKRADYPNLKWVALEKDEDGFSIPGRADGWVRIGWKDDKTGNVGFAAEMWVYEPNSGVIFTLNAGVNFVDAVKVCWADETDKADANVGKLSPGDHREAQFMIWSPTREKFKIVKTLLRKDPCVQVGAVTPLSAKELDYLPKKPEEGNKALSGYRVVVTVNERVGEDQLDIGPFRRMISWETDASPQPVRGSVFGSVLGEVSAHIAGKPDGYRLDMGRIDPQNPVVHNITIESADPQVELTLDDKSLDILKVELAEGAKGKDVNLPDGSVRRTWTVHVSYRPDSGFPGRFPDNDRAGYTVADCVVAFKIAHAGEKNERQRRIRVPVAGQVAN